MQYASGSRLKQFFATVPVPCPYLAELAEQKLVIDLAGADAPLLYDDLARAGFRRSHALAYRPACRGCSACVPVRIRVAAFTPGRSLRRVARRNAAVTGTIMPAEATVEQYQLFARYQRSRHGQSDMATMTLADYRAMIEESPLRTAVIEFRENGILIGACLVDRLRDAVSAVYSFFEPDMPQRSLGTQAILWLVAHARATGLGFVYLGYWISGSETMDYKRRFPALEQLAGPDWVPLPAEGDAWSG